MDPNETLRVLRTMVKSMNAHLSNAGDEGPDDPMTLLDELSDLVDCWDGLDEWLSKGGFLPNEWTKARLADSQHGHAERDGSRSPHVGPQGESWLDAYWVVCVERNSGTSSTLGPYSDADEAHAVAARLSGDSSRPYVAVVGRR